jgi:hypothetical protein
MKERLYTGRGRLTHICSPFRPGASQRQKLKARRNRRHILYTTLHFTTALDASLHPVVIPHDHLFCFFKLLFSFTGWTWDVFQEWGVFLKLAVGGLCWCFMEIFSFELGTLLAGK